MNDPSKLESRSEADDGTWDFEGTWRHHIRQGLRLTPVERLQWLEETVAEMRQLQGLARSVRKTEEKPDPETLGTGEMPA
jgi:hypothetical protein